jgi:predicted tellurium resistance membrane protein TerC
MNLFGANNFYSGLSLVANSALSDIWTFVFIIFGIVFAFWIIEMLIDFIKLRNETKRGIGLFGSAENRTEVSDDEYKLKEWLYEHK